MTVAYALRQADVFQVLRFPIQSLRYYLPLLPLAIGLLLLLLWQAGLYRPLTPAAGLSTSIKVVRGGALWMLLLMTLSFLAQRDPSRTLLLLGGGLTIPFLLVGRWLAAEWERLDRGQDTRRMILIGEVHRHELPRAFRAFSTRDTTSVPVDERLRTHPHRVEELLRASGATDVVLVDRTLPYDLILMIIATTGARQARFWVRADLFPLLSGTLPADAETAPYLVLDLAAAHGLWARGGKRLFDLGVVLAVLPLALPLAAVVSGAIWLDAGRPILFSHDRVGFRGHRFRMLKFRSMVSGTPALADAPRTPDDARVTRVGRWLRRWSLDELPQLWNVLRGDMSLVGPRPEMPHIVTQYAPWQRLRCQIRPGLTGVWQILGRKEVPLHENLEYDVYYVFNVSAALDLAILLKTPPRILTGRGAF